MTTASAYNAPEKKDLRSFGLIFASGMILIFGLFLPWLLDKAWPSWPWMVAAVFATSGLLLPQLLRPVYWLWMKFGAVMGWINTRLILGITFALFFVPVALVFRIIGKDPMRRKLDPSVDSYRINSEHLPRERMEKPF